MSATVIGPVGVRARRDGGRGIEMSLKLVVVAKIPGYLENVLRSTTGMLGEKI